MQYIITFQIIDDINESIYFRSIVCDESEVANVQQNFLSAYAPFIEIESVLPYEGPDDDSNDDEALPF